MRKKIWWYFRFITTWSFFQDYKGNNNLFLEWLWIIEFEHVLDCKKGQFWFHIDVKMKNTFCLYGV